MAKGKAGKKAKKAVDTPEQEVSSFDPTSAGSIFRLGTVTQRFRTITRKYPKLPKSLQVARKKPRAKKAKTR